MKDVYKEPLLRNSLSNLKKNFKKTADEAALESFWQICSKKISFFTHPDTISKIFSEYNQKTEEVKRAFDGFQKFLHDVPLIVAIQHWVGGIINDEYTKDRYLKRFTFLIEKNLIPLTLNLSPVTLSDMRSKGHQDIIENIRCVPNLTFSEKEELVQCYLRFSYDLAKYTLDYVLAGYDSDRFATSSRLISYEAFYCFIQFLSKRDALIAKVLYFGAPSMEEVLSLKTNAIDEASCTIHFKDKSEKFPKHLIQDLIQYVREYTNLKELVFANNRGELVERAHLNQSFARASEKLPKDVKITPGALLRFNFEPASLAEKKFHN